MAWLRAAVDASCVLAVFLLACCLLGAAVQITDLRVPPAVRNGSGSAALLDCEFSLRPEELSPESGLVVKWFFNSGPEPVYQWIPGQRPQELGALRGRLNVSHRATAHRATMHRALYIVRPTTELSGDYKCQVSTFGDEDFMTKRMVVFAPAKNLDFTQVRTGPDSVNITCKAQGVYPEPKMALFRERDKTTKNPMEGVTVEATSRRGAYDITAFKVLDERELVSPTIFDCELRIPEANYHVRKSIIYYSGMMAPMSDRGCHTHAPDHVPLMLLLVTSLLGYSFIGC